MGQCGVVFFGDNKACKVFRIGTVKLKIFDDRDFLLHSVGYVP